MPGALYADLRYAFEVPGYQAVLTVTVPDTDIGRVIGATDDVDEFVRGISCSNEPADDVGDLA